MHCAGCRVALLGLYLVAAAAGAASQAISAQPANRIMGTGEARDPQVFTREQRLLHAVRTGDEATVRRALELGVSVHTRDDLGRSALLLAIRDARSLALASLLAARGAWPDEPDAGGRTPVSYAASLGRLDLLEFLASNGAAIDSRDTLGRTPLFHAAISNQADMIEALHARGAALDPRQRDQSTPLIAACAKDARAAVETLHALGADVSAVDKWGRSAKDRAVVGTPACLAFED